MEIKVEDTTLNECIKSLQDLIRIPSVKSGAVEGAPFGKSVKEGLDFFLNKAEGLGFTTRNLEGYAGIAEMGCGKEELAILVHLDVVPPGDIEQWELPPFSGVIKDERIWGRGTFDDKGPAMAVLYAMKLVEDLKPNFNKRIRLVVGTDEESTWQGIEYYKTKEKAPTFGFTPDGSFPVTINEKGILTLDYKKNITSKSVIKEIESGERHNVIPGKAVAKVVFEQDELQLSSTASVSVKKKNGCTWEIVAIGTEGRTSEPSVMKNAIDVLIDYLRVFLKKYDGFWEVIRFYDHYLKVADGAGHGLKISDDVSGNLTVAPCILRVKGGEALLMSNIRYPSTYSLEEMKEMIEGGLAESGFQWSIVDHKEPVHVDESSPIVQQLLHVYNAYFKTDEKPVSISGATYARAFPHTVAFGALIPGMELTAHEPNEHVKIDVVRDWINIYAQAIYALAVDDPLNAT